MATKIGARKDSRIMRYVKMPMRVLGQARRLYENSMMGCAGKVGYGSAAMGSQFDSLPRSFSVKSTASEEDFRELVRASSTGVGPRSAVISSPKKSPAVVPRSHTVAFGRIDEEKACEFGAGITSEEVVYPRSRSCYEGWSRMKMKR